eukprot:SRR837773.4067.p1 GENE.SRR837773.4067~~SRR837773.4067.p1  ORF type:complete len:247 (-),score=87.04 SRR837773.4067:15-719(-)
MAGQEFTVDVQPDALVRDLRRLFGEAMGVNMALTFDAEPAELGVFERLPGYNFVKLFLGETELDNDDARWDEGYSPDMDFTVVRTPDLVIRRCAEAQLQAGEPEAREVAVIESILEAMRANGGVTRHLFRSQHPYIIHFCTGPSLATAVHSVPIDCQHTAHLHRQTGLGRSGVMEVQPKYLRKEDGSAAAIFLFEGGYPMGGRCWADVRAPWDRLFEQDYVQRGGSTIIEVPLP